MVSKFKQTESDILDSAPYNLILKNENDDSKGNFYLGNQTIVGFYFKFEQDKKEEIQKAAIDNLNNMKIKAIVCCADNYEFFPQLFKYHQIPIGDSKSNDIIPFVTKGIDFIHEELKNGNVYVHCNAGASRSPTITICYLMKYQNMSFKEAYAFVREKRRIVDISNFENQIIENENKIKGKE